MDSLISESLRTQHLCSLTFVPFLDVALHLVHLSRTQAGRQASTPLRHQVYFSSFQAKSHFLPLTPVQYEKQLPPEWDNPSRGEHDAFIWSLPKFFCFVVTSLYLSWVFWVFFFTLSAPRCVTLCLLSITWHQQEEMEAFTRKSSLAKKHTLPVTSISLFARLRQFISS